MNREEFIGKLQMVYVGDRNASADIISEFDRLNNIIDELERHIKTVVTHEQMEQMSYKVGGVNDNTTKNE